MPLNAIARYSTDYSELKSFVPTFFRSHQQIMITAEKYTAHIIYEKITSKAGLITGSIKANIKGIAVRTAEAIRSLILI